MRKIFLILATLLSIGVSAQVPSTDSLLRYNDQYIRNSAITAFTNNRLNTLLKGIIENLAAGGGGGSILVQLRTNATHIQYKYSNQSDFFWTNLIALDELRGPAGATGATGAAGPQGVPGPSVEIGHNTTHLQYRPVGGTTWVNIIPLDSLKGPQGPPGSGGGGGSSVWGAITGSILDQLDLQTALAGRQPIGSIYFAGLATALNSVNVPNTFPMIQTSGYSIVGKGGAKYVRDTLTTPTRWRLQTADGQWWRLAESYIHVDMFGAVGDSSLVNSAYNTASIQAGLDFTQAGTMYRNGVGAALHFDGGGKYMINNKLQIHSGNLMTDERVQAKGGFNYTNGNGAALITHNGTLPADSFMIVADHNAAGWGINGLQIIGGGVGASTTTTGAIKNSSGPTGLAHDFRITNNTIKGWGIEAVVVTGTPYKIMDNMIQGCNNISYVTGKGVPTGVIRAAGADATIKSNEFTGSQNQAGTGNMVTPSAAQLIGAAYFGGLGVSKLEGNIYQVAECGLRHPGGNNRYTLERFDTNAGSGLYFVSGGSDNRFEQIQIIRNSLAGTGLYDGIYSDVTGGRNTFDGVEFGAGAPYAGQSYQMKLFINDLKADLGTNNAFVNSYANLYYTSTPADAAMFKFFGVSEGAGRIIVPQGGPFRRIIGETPSVTLGSNYMAYNASATSITNFRGGVAGQEIGLVWSPLAGGNTWVKHGDSIKLRKGMDSIQLNDLVVEKFVFTGKYWLQTTGASAGEGTYQPLNLYLSQLSALVPGNGAFLSYDNGWKTFNNTQQRNRLNVYSKEEVQGKIDSLAAANPGGGGGYPNPGGNGVLVQTATNTLVARTLTAENGQITIANPNGVSGNPIIGIGSGIPANKLIDGSLDNVELGYLNGASSNIQAQIDALKADSTVILADSMPTANSQRYPTSGGTKSMIDSLAAIRAPLASPAFTGTPTAPTATAGTNTTQLATTAFVQAALTPASSSAAGVMTVNQYNRLFTRQTSANPTGTITVNVNSGAQIGITFTATGGRTLAFSNLVAGDLVKIAFDNTSGATIALTLPSNSFSAGTGSAASVTIPTGKSVLSLVDYDGTNYYFSLQSY